MAGMNVQQLKTWQDTMGFTTNDAASALGMTPNAYRDMINGKSSISRRTELACLALWVGEDKLSAPWYH